jgi:anaphase-promoting complex subunit 2
LTADFSRQVSRRLLHAGATTTNILNIYISIIRAFNELDSKGVLLDRVARPIRRYLRDREDTARIIVASFLADIEDESGQAIDPGPDISIEIAKEMLNPITAFDEHDQDMDWDNMNWTPDPVDAGPEYKKSKSSDVTSSLLSLYKKVEFINDLKTILGEHLLKNEDSRFEKEVRLLELFKHRLGDKDLQDCEVMLHDAQQSLRMNTAIHNVPSYRAASARSPGTELNAQILSRNFWPDLKDADFAVPPPIKALQEQYEREFERKKGMRKLEWLPALGRVTVELEFEDRMVEEAVPPWIASVIYAFQSTDPNVAVELSVDELASSLSMDESLVRNALVFWVSKTVLRALPDAPDTYTVLDTLSTQTTAADSAEQAAQQAQAQAVMDAETVSAVKSQDDIFQENLELYRQFVVGMLTNQGNLPLARIVMMLKVVVPGGFPFGLEEVRGMLSALVEEGTVAGVGDVYGIKRD